MKKISTALFALTLSSVAVMSSHAAFTSKGKSAVTATVTTLGQKTVSVSLKIKDHVDVNSPDRAQIAWANIDPANLGSNPWKIADQLVVANTSISDLTGGIQLVTDNTNVAASPLFVDPSPTISSNTDSNPAGLLLVPPTGNSSSLTLPLAWSVKDSSKTVGSTNLLNGIGASNPNRNTGVLDGSDNPYQWLYVIDKKSPAIDLNGSGTLGDRNQNGADSTAFIEGQEYSRLADARGFHYAQANADNTPAFGGGAGNKTLYVYFQADFSGALAGNTYKTNQLTFEAFTE